MKKILFVALAALLASCAKAPEVSYKIWYDWPERYLPDFSTLGEPDLQGTKINLDLEEIDDQKNHFCVLFEAPLKVNKEEEYAFTLTTDDGSKFYIDDELLIENDGAHGPIEKKIGSKSNSSTLTRARPLPSSIPPLPSRKGNTTTRSSRKKTNSPTNTSMSSLR